MKSHVNVFFKSLVSFTVMNYIQLCLSSSLFQFYCVQLGFMSVILF